MTQLVIVPKSVAVPKIATATVATSDANPPTAGYGAMTTPGPAVSVAVPASGVVVVMLTARVTITIGNQSSPSVFMSVALTGANVLAAADARALLQTLGAVAQTTQGATPFRASAVVPLTGLAPGVTTFTAQYKASAGTGVVYAVANRDLTVVTFP